MDSQESSTAAAARQSGFIKLEDDIGNLQRAVRITDQLIESILSLDGRSPEHGYFKLCLHRDQVDDLLFMSGEALRHMTAVKATYYAAAGGQGGDA